MPDVLIGSYSWNMAPLSPQPNVVLYYGSQAAKTLSGSARMLGSLRCRLSYKSIQLTGEEYYQLRKLVNRQMSGPVYVRIPIDQVDLNTYEPIWHTYTGILHWPDEGVMQGLYDRWKMPDVEISHLVSYL